MKGDPVKIGIIGTGQVCRGHLRTINLLKGIELLALCDIHEANLRNASHYVEELKIPGWKTLQTFRKYEDLLKIEDLEAVLIATPNYTHKDFAIASLESGKHVLCEKPMATQARDCEEMVKVWRKSRKVLQIGLEYRHAPLYRRMKQLLEKGEIGNPRILWCKEFRGPFAKKSEDWILQKEKSGGSLVEKDCHHFDLFNWYVESTPVRVSGFGGNEVIYQKRDILDHAWVIVEYENGARACLGLCFFSPYGNDILELGIIGDEGKMESYQTSMEIIIWKRRKPSKKVFPVYIPPHIRKSSHNGAIYYEWRHFLEAVRGAEKPYPNGEIGKWSVAVPEAAEISVKEKRVVEIKELQHAY